MKETLLLSVEFLNIFQMCNYCKVKLLSEHTCLLVSELCQQLQTFCIFQVLHFETFVRLSQARRCGPDWESLECGHMGHNLL